MRVREATAHDTGAVGAILSAFVDDTPWMPRVHSRAQDLAHAESLIARGWVNVVEDQGQVIGFAAREGTEVHALYIAVSDWRRGAGAMLLNDLKAQADVLQLWTFEANTQAQAFYAAHDFVETERTDGATNDEGLPDIRLVWTRKDT